MVQYWATSHGHYTTNFGWQKAQQNLTSDVDKLDGLIGLGVLKYWAQLIENFLLVSWCQIYLCKFLEFHGSSSHGYNFHHMVFQGYMCKL
jgi:hypothetical protein